MMPVHGEAQKKNSYKSKKIKSIVCGHLVDEDLILNTPLEETQALNDRQKYGFYGMFRHVWKLDKR